MKICDDLGSKIVGATIFLVILGFFGGLPIILMQEAKEFKAACHIEGGKVGRSHDINGANTGDRYHLCIKGDKIIMREYITG